MTPRQRDGNGGSTGRDGDQLGGTNGAHTQGCPDQSHSRLHTQHYAQLALESQLLQLSLVLGQRTWLGEGKNIHLKGMEPPRTQSSGLLFQQLGVISHPWHWGMRKSYLIFSASFSPSVSSPIPTKVISTSTPWGKMWLASTSYQHSYQRH